MFPGKDQYFIETVCQADYPWQQNAINALIKKGWRVLSLQYLPDDYRSNGLQYYRIAMTREPDGRPHKTRDSA